MAFPYVLYSFISGFMEYYLVFCDNGNEAISIYEIKNKNAIWIQIVINRFKSVNYVFIIDQIACGTLGYDNGIDWVFKLKIAHVPKYKSTILVFFLRNVNHVL